MKTLIKICIFLTISLSFAQEDEILNIKELGHYNEDVTKYYYYKDLDGILNKFLGTWKFEDATKLFEITFYFKEKSESGGDFNDEIYAKYKYIKDGTIIYDTTDSTEFSTEIFGSYFYLNNFNKMSLGYFERTDIAYHGTARLSIEYLGCNTDCELKWDINYHIPSTSNPTPYPWPFKIPTNMILIKQ